MTGCNCEINRCVLCEQQMLTGLPEAAECHVRDTLSKQNSRAGEMLFREGESNTHIYVLRTGLVKLTSSLDDGREQVIGLTAPGYLLGFHTLKDKVYRYSAIAATKVNACKVRHRDMLRVLDKHPSVSMKVIDILNHELDHTRTMLRVVGHKTAIEKTASFILSLIPRTGPKKPSEIPMPLSRREIADVLGLAEETVSRIMAELQRARVILTPRGKIVIFDHTRLKCIAEGENIASATTQ